MALNEQEVLQVLAMFQQSGWEQMHLQSGSFRLSISKTGRPQARAESAPAVAPSSTAPAVDPRWQMVKAPMLGHFYAAPKPGAPPFVTLGQQVAADDTVAILEVMKLMNHVKAGIAGRIAQLAVGNGELVEFDQVLLYIDPS